MATAHDAPEWRTVLGFPQYSVSSAGQLRRDSAGRGTRPGTIIKGSLGSDGYLYTVMPDRRKYTLHRLVAIAFHGEPPSGHEVAHNDGTRTNNAASNLRWATRFENMADKKAHGTENLGSRHGMSKLTEEQVLRIRASDRPQRELAVEYDVDQSAISLVRTRRNWKHI